VLLACYANMFSVIIAIVTLEIAHPFVCAKTWTLALIATNATANATAIIEHCITLYAQFLTLSFTFGNFSLACGELL